MPAEECIDCGTKWLREADAIELDRLLGREPRIDLWADLNRLDGHGRGVASIGPDASFEVGNVLVVCTPDHSQRALVVEVDHIAGLVYFEPIRPT